MIEKFLVHAENKGYFSNIIHRHFFRLPLLIKSNQDYPKFIDAISQLPYIITWSALNLAVLVIDPIDVKPRRAGDLSFSDGRGISASVSVSLLLLQAAVLHRDRKVPAQSQVPRSHQA